MNPYSITLLISALAQVFIGLYAVVFHRNRISDIFAALVFASALYCFGYGMELRSSSLESIRFWYHFQYLTIPLIAPFWLTLAIHFTRFKYFTSRYIFIVLLSIAAVFIGLVQTNQFHQLYYTELGITEHQGILLSKYTRNWLYTVHAIYQNTLFLIGNLIFLHAMLTQRGMLGNKSRVMFIGSVIPWVFHLVYLLGGSKLGLDLAAISLGFAGILYLWGISRYQLLSFDQITIDNVFDSIRDVIIVTDNDLIIRRINPAGLKLCERKASQVIGESFGTIFAPFPQLHGLLQGNEVHNQDVSLSASDEKVFSLSISNIYDSQVRIGRIIIMHDVSELKLSERRNRENEKQLRSLIVTKDKLFSIIANDLKDPLASIWLLVESIRKGLDEKDLNEVQQNSNALQLTANQMHNLLTNLLEWAKTKTTVFEPQIEDVNLRKLIAEAVMLVEQSAVQKGITIEPCRTNITLRTDSNMLNTIILNLISNAIKYTNMGGRITINSQVTDNEVVVSILDNGVGINSKRLALLLSPNAGFTTPGTSREKGSGLGLTICREFIDRLGGRMWIESEWGKSTKVNVSLPRV